MVRILHRSSCRRETCSSNDQHQRAAGDTRVSGHASTAAPVHAIGRRPIHSAALLGRESAFNQERVCENLRLNCFVPEEDKIPSWEWPSSTRRRGRGPLPTN